MATKGNWQGYFKYTKSRELLTQGRLTQEEVDHLLFVLPYTEHTAFTQMLDALLVSKRPQVITNWIKTLSLSITYRNVTVKRDAFILPGLMTLLDKTIASYVEANWQTVVELWFAPEQQEDRTA